MGRRPKPGPRWHAFVLALTGAVILASFLLSATPEGVGLFGWELPYRCGVREILGFPCPGCGLTRSFVLTAHGHPIEATRVHPLGAAGWLAVAVQVPYRVWMLRRSR